MTPTPTVFLNWTCLTCGFTTLLIAPLSNIVDPPSRLIPPHLVPIFRECPSYTNGWTQRSTSQQPFVFHNKSSRGWKKGIYHDRFDLFGINQTSGFTRYLSMFFNVKIKREKCRSGLNDSSAGFPGAHENG